VERPEDIRSLSVEEGSWSEGASQEVSVRRGTLLTGSTSGES
jgi:hypothetical protein